MMSMELFGSIGDGLEETKKPMVMMKLDVPLHTCSPWLWSVWTLAHALGALCGVSCTSWSPLWLVNDGWSP